MSFHHFFSENTLHVSSSTDTTTSKQESKDLSGTLSMTMYGGGSGMGASLGYGEGHSTSDSTTNTNSELLAKNITITTTNDASFKGATVQADDTLNVKVGGDLNVESQRDSSSSNSKGFNVSVSASLGGDKDYTSSSRAQQNTLNNTVGARVGDGLGSTGASYGANAGTTQSKQTVLTSLTGENVNVEVENNTHVKGALIAAGETNEQGTFQDNGNLNLSTGTLTFANSTNSQYSSSNSYSVGTNIGYTTGKNTQTNVEETTGKVNSSTLSLSNEMGYSRSKTLATVGEGTLHVKDTENSDELTRLNRDTSKVSKELYSGSVGTSVSATLDHRLLSEVERKEIKQEYEDMGKNMAIIGKTLPKAESDNPIESTIGTIWDWMAHGTLDILPSNKNNGGVLGNVPIWFGTNDNLHKLQGDENSKDVYLNGILNSEADAMQGGKNIIGEDKTYVNPYNPTRGILGDLIEAGVDKWGDSIGMQTGISKQVQEYLNNNTDLNLYMHSQGNLVTKQGALGSKDNGHVYKSYGAPMSDTQIIKVFEIEDKDDIQKNDGDYVSNPLNIFNPTTWNKPGHGTENYGAAKQAKEEGVK
ncbi:MAG: hemagglutinin repeat-containing protein [Sulfurospirillaceae bacterium]|nr:hemagglutinin repeat-containing protein [Sulfurospirillaceae bacterium]